MLILWQVLLRRCWRSYPGRRVRRWCRAWSIPLAFILGVALALLPSL